MDLSDLDVINHRGQKLNATKIAQTLDDEGFLLVKGATDLTKIESTKKVEKSIVFNHAVKAILLLGRKDDFRITNYATYAKKDWT